MIRVRYQIKGQGRQLDRAEPTRYILAIFNLDARVVTQSHPAPAPGRPGSRTTVRVRPDCEPVYTVDDWSLTSFYVSG